MTEHREGFFKDGAGNWQPDRRLKERRDVRLAAVDNQERRQYYRRRADRETLAKMDHKAMIKEALEDFAEEHDGRL